MGDFGWEYIDVDQLTSASGPTGSVMYRIGDMGSKSAISGSDNLMFHTASNLFAITGCLLYTSPSPRDRQKSRMPSSA